MNNNAKKWVAALRSGEYKQTTGHLRDQKGFCCLGVACELYMKENPDLLKVDRHGLYYSTVEAVFGVLSEPIMNWLGLREAAGIHETNEGPLSLTNYNDVKRLSFAAIANIIETEPEGLFVPEELSATKCVDVLPDCGQQTDRDTVSNPD